MVKRINFTLFFIIIKNQKIYKVYWNTCTNSNNYNFRGIFSVKHLLSEFHKIKLFPVERYS